MNTKQPKQLNHKRVTLKQAMATILMTGTLLSAQGAQNITAAEAEQINAQLAPVINPEANTEKVGSVPEDPAAVVGTRFSYQGTLRLGNDRANGPYDFRFKLWDQVAGGTQLGSTQTKNDVPVTDGLFSTTLDFGQAPIDGDDIFLEIKVRDGASAGAYTLLTPRQRINATPYAVRALASGDGGGGASPWTVNGTKIYYNDGNVGIGTINPAYPLDVKTSNSTPVSIEGGDRSYVRFAEQGSMRGYFGSWQNGTATNDADFEIGTSINNTAGSMHITTKATPRITVDPNGRVGVGTVNPLAQLHVEAPSGTAPLRVRINGTSRFSVFSSGQTYLYGDAKQSNGFGGILKAAVYISSCGGPVGASTAVTRQYNGVSAPAITAIDNGTGKCIIDFPFNIDGRFWVAQPFNAPGAYGLAAMCNTSASDKLSCARWNTVTDLRTSGKLMVLIY